MNNIFKNKIEIGIPAKLKNVVGSIIFLISFFVGFGIGEILFLNIYLCLATFVIFIYLLYKYQKEKEDMNDKFNFLFFLGLTLGFSFSLLFLNFI